MQQFSNGHGCRSPSIGSKSSPTTCRPGRDVTGSPQVVQSSPFEVNKFLMESSSQTFPVDWNHVETKCPCCHHSMRIDFNWKPDSVDVTLIPLPKQSPLMDQIQSSSGVNSSLMNIVSVESVDDKDLSSKDLTATRTFVYNTSSNHHNLEEDDEDSLEAVNESTSSSLSTNSGRNFSNSGVMRTVTKSDLNSHLIQLTAVPGFTSVQASKLRPSLETSLVPPTINPFVGQMMPNQGPRVNCQFNGCGLTFVNNQQLELHYKEHKGEKIQKCDWYQCNRLFSSKEKLRNHVRCRHTGERPFKCDQCDKAFTSPKHLKDHHLLHSGQFIPSAWSLYSSFKTDERPFPCEWDGCGQRFRRRHHLVAHKRVHTKERPYACQFPGCDMKFTKTHHVKRHYETHFKYNTLKPELSGVLPPTAHQSPPGLNPSLPSTSSLGYMFL